MLQQHFQGQAAELVAAAKQSALALVQLVSAHLPGFRDHAIYKGRQVRLVGALGGAVSWTGVSCQCNTRHGATGTPAMCCKDSCKCW
jgi:hypothetical protein